MAPTGGPGSLRLPATVRENCDATGCEAWAVSAQQFSIIPALRHKRRAVSPASTVADTPYALDEVRHSQPPDPEFTPEPMLKCRARERETATWGGPDAAFHEEMPAGGQDGLTRTRQCPARGRLGCRHGARGASP